MTGAWLVLFIALWVVCLLLTILVLGLNRRTQAIEALLTRETGAMAGPGQKLVGQNIAEAAQQAGLASSEDDLRSVVIFVSDGCGPCAQLEWELARAPENVTGAGLAVELGTRLTIFADAPGSFSEAGATDVVVEDGTVRRSFGVAATPLGVALDATGTVRAVRVTNRVEDVRELASASTGLLSVVSPAA